jgi:hypothetical protein
MLNGKKRHILVETSGLLLNAVVHPAYIRDRDGASWEAGGNKGSINAGSEAVKALE